MPDQLEHALRHRTELLASRSKAEVAAINTLQLAYELLLFRNSKESYVLPPGRIRRPQSARARPSTPTRSIKRGSISSEACTAISGGNYEEQGKTKVDGAVTLETYASLVQLVGKLSKTHGKLEAEVLGSERRSRALQADPGSFLPPVDPTDLPPRLQVLHSVLGQQRFQQYTRDLYAEVARLRRALRLYGSRYDHFAKGISASGVKAISSDAVSIMLQQWICDATVDVPATLVRSSEHASAVLYPLIFQHCGDSQTPARLSVEELTSLLCSIPNAREKLVRHTFEQLADGWRGEGYAPPPDSLRAHRLLAAAKESFAHRQCSPAERDMVAAWISSVDPGGTGNAPVSLRAFLEFHNAKSDEFALEDAEFVRFLLRIWCFDPSSSLAAAPRSDRDAVARVILSSDERSIHERLVARKQELISKVESALGGIDSRAQHLRIQLGALLHLEIKDPTASEWWSDAQFAAHLGSSLAALRVLVASSCSLPTFPAFLGSLRHLDTLDLRDNRLSVIPHELGQLQALARLDISANCLTDASFAESKCTWCSLMTLRELVLRGNRLTSVPEQVASLNALERLDLADNAIRRVPKSVLNELGKLAKLVSLDLHHNALANLPEEVGLLQELRHLQLHENALRCLPASITLLTKLEELTLRENQLGGDFLELPVADDQSRIELDRNNIRELPHVKLVSNSPTIPSRITIVSLSACNNQLRRLTLSPTSAFAACKDIHLAHNAIRELSGAFFEALPQLEKLVVHHNRLQRVPDAITTCKCLRVIDMHANRIAEVPASMVELAQLEVLDLTDNALQLIPIEWHGFAKHTRSPSGGPRILQTLALRRNPIRNSVLMSIVDSSSRNDSSEISAVLSSTSDRVCANVLRKLISGLRDAATTNAAFCCASSDSDEESWECGAPHGRREWRGVTRDVNRYLAQRMRAMNRQKGGKRLLVEAKSFERLIKSLPFSCSKVELAVLIKRLAAADTDNKQWVDGDAFLASIDSFGRSGAAPPLTAASPRRPMAGMQPDAVVPILHYLSIMHSQQKSRKDSKRDRVADVAEEDQVLKPSTRTFQEKKVPRVSPQERNRRKPKASATKASQVRPEAASNASVARVGTSSRVGELSRQRQRVEVLKQQLMDQKLRCLHEPIRTPASQISSAVMEANSSSDSDADSGSADRELEADDHGSDSVRVRVSLPTAEATKLALGARHLDIRIGVLQTVLELKQRIEVLGHVPVVNQILVARLQGQATGIRLCNASTIQQSVRSDRHISDKEPWRLLLLLRHGI